jgi:hypothetical protein
VNAVRIPSTESPHAHEEKSEYGLADRTWLESMYRKYGKRSFWTNCHIHAEIPVENAAQLINPRHLDACVDAPRSRLAGPLFMAVDLGEGAGRDETAILIRNHAGILHLEASRYDGLEAAAASVARLAREYLIDSSRISYDAVGIGRNFQTYLDRHGVFGRKYNGSGASSEPRAYANFRSECAWRMAQRLNPEFSDEPFSIPNCDWWPQLREDLEALTYDLRSGKIQLVLKLDLLAKLGRSPDRGDAFIQSFCAGGQHV